MFLIITLYFLLYLEKNLGQSGPHHGKEGKVLSLQPGEQLVPGRGGSEMTMV